MKGAWLALLVPLLHLALGQLKCSPQEKCLCLVGHDFEIQCPKNNSGSPDYVLHITEEKKVLIDCALYLDKFDIQKLPNITLAKLELFQMRFCPLPEQGFRQVLDWFSVQEVEFLQYGSRDHAVATLTKDYFKGLEDLQSLKLDADGLVDVEEDVFANTPKLTSLELQINNITLKASLFKTTPLLKALDMAENRFESIPEGLFQGLDKLETLHLWGNELKTIKKSTFKGLTSLKLLELSANKIESISEDALEGLGNLTQINLSVNSLGALRANIFSHNRKLKLVLMRGNPNLRLPEYLFSNLSFLEEIELTNCKLETIPEYIFEDSSNIKILKLGRNKLRFLPKALFKGLKKLEEINLADNKLEIVDEVFASLKSLKVLLLEGNQISAIDQNAFKDLTDLETINLKGNQIATIHPRVFYNNNNLKTINLAHNRYTGDDDSQLILLENVHNAESVDLSYNMITQIDDVITLYNKISLSFLDLSHNRITHISLKDLQALAKKLMINLEYNNITTVDFKYVEDLATSGDIKDAFSNNDQAHSVISLSNNPLNCDCYNYDLIKYFQNELRPEVRVMYDIKSDDLTCASPPELKDVPVEVLPPRLLTCGLEKLTSASTGCPEACTCSWRPFDKTVIIDCSSKNLTDFPQISFDNIPSLNFNQTEIHLEGNYLSHGPSGNMTGYGNVTKLFLSHNQIKTITWLPPRLKVLSLDNNQISGLSYKVLDKLNSSSLENLTLDNNPWSCECEAENFTNFLRQHTKVDARHIHCVNSSRLLIDLNRNDLCHEWQAAYLALIMMMFLLVVAVLFALYYRYQQELKVWLFAHNMCLWWVTEEELDKDKIYDAFISYSHRDEDFVVQNLLPVLEGGPVPYKLCLHYRNWVPGEFITTQVTNSVLESRRTLVVLSPNFLESVWGKMEFRTAHTQAMTEGRARVIIVLYGDVDMASLDDELKSYLKTNTYVKWGDPYFWNKLKYALPHSKGNVANNNQKIANVMNCIDDKFNLVAPATPSPGTTPPVLALDSDVLRKHPLNFVPSSEMDTPPAEAGTLLVSTCL